MALANVTLDNTFDVWRTRTNQILNIINNLTEGLHNSTGAITLSNPSSLNGGVTLNVSNGFIKVGPNNFSSNATVLVSNTGALSISGSGQLGTRIFIDIGTLVTSNSDTGISNIASANLVNANYISATTIAAAATLSAYNQANNSNITAISAYEHSNAVNITAISAYAHSNAVNITAISAYAHSNAVNITAISAYALANTVNTIAITANTRAFLINLTFLGVDTVIQPLLSQTSIGLFKSKLGLGDANTLGVMTPTQWWTNTASKIVTTDKAHSSAGIVTLPQVAANVVVDMGTFINGYVNISNNKLLKNPTNVVDGRSGTISIRNVSTYSISFDTKWKPIGGTAAAEAGNEMLLSWFSRDSSNIFFSWARAGTY